MRETRPVRRRGVLRLSGATWGSGQSIWAAEAEGRDLAVDMVSVTDEEPPAQVARVLGLASGAPACVRRCRYVMDGRPIVAATSYLDAALVFGTPITKPDPGPGGVYARLGEIGQRPVRFREEVRCRTPSAAETERLALPPVKPVVLLCRTAFTAEGRAVEVNDMVLDAAAHILEYDIEA